MSLVEIGIAAVMLIVSAAFIYLASAIAKYIKGASKVSGTLEQIVTIMNFFKDAIKLLIGDDWAEVYEAVRKALSAVADGHLSRAEAYASAKDVFNVAIGFTNVKLDNESKEIIYKIIEARVNMLISDAIDPNASVRALDLSRI